LLQVWELFAMTSDFLIHEVSLISLRRRWWVMAVLCVPLLLLGYQLLRTEWHLSYAWRWTMAAAGILAYELWLLWRGLKDNRLRGGSTLLPTLGVGNILTMLRGLALGLLAGFLFSPWPPGRLAWMPAMLYTMAIIADYLDGYLARITHRATVLGENLDIEFDALGMLIAISLAVHYAQLPGWYLLLGLSRYLFLLGIWWRKQQGKPVYDLPPSAHRRMVAGFQMVFMSVMLWPVVYPPLTTLAGVVFAIPFVASFTRDWFVVSGRIDPASHAYLEARQRIAVVMTRWLPLLLRIGVVTAAVGFVLPALWSAPERVASFAWPGGPLPGVTTTIISAVAIVASVMLALGGAGRLAALGLLIAASTNILSRGLYIYNGFMLTGAIALIFLGSGAFSCWRPEDVVLGRRAGEKRGPGL
jgi:CDP-diacylglycerol--glycerol-3-phosphate 3-phosphatidyltransferase